MSPQFIGNGRYGNGSWFFERIWIRYAFDMRNLYAIYP